MIKLIVQFILLSICSPVMAAQEIATKEDTQKIVSTLKDVEVGKMLERTSEFKTCREDNKFDPQKSKAERDKSIQKAEQCIKDRILKGENSKEKLEELSNNLNLQQYGLVKSKSSKDIQEYLLDKMYESMTGISRKNQESKEYFESLKFNKKKHVDQKTFVSLYKTQLSKNALYEISRYCFENFRLKTPPNNQDPTSFAEHWKSFNDKISLDDVTDEGKPKFGKISKPDDKDTVYKDIFESINGSGVTGFPTDKLSSFFGTRGSLITRLCEEFKKQKPNDLEKPESDVEQKSVRGAASCLAKSRLVEIKGAISSTEKVIEIFKEIEADPKKAGTMLTSNLPTRLFGEDPSDESIDNLTNYTSSDIIEGGLTKDDLAQNKYDQCEKAPELANCEDFFMKAESVDKIKNNIETEMTIKREVEVARVKKLKQDSEADLKTYLENNGYFTILNEYKNHDDKWLEEQIGKEFESKKVALLSEINTKLGKRQVSKKSKDANDSVMANYKEVIQDSKEERARIGQVVLFNNIITSHLDLTRIDKDNNATSAGRNVNAWKKEEQALKKSQIDSSLFSNLKSTENSTGVKAIGKDEEIGGIGFIETILGKKSEK